MSNLIEFLLKLVQEPELAAQFRDDPAASLADVDLSADEHAQLQAMMPAYTMQTDVDDAPTAISTLQSGQFYVGDDLGHHVFSVYTKSAKMTTADAGQEDNKDARIKVYDPDDPDGTSQKWRDPRVLILKGQGKVYLDHEVDSKESLTGSIVALAILVDEKQKKPLVDDNE